MRPPQKGYFIVSRGLIGTGAPACPAGNQIPYKFNTVRVANMSDEEKPIVPWGRKKTTVESTRPVVPWSSNPASSAAPPKPVAPWSSGRATVETSKPPDPWSSTAIAEPPESPPKVRKTKEARKPVTTESPFPKEPKRRSTREAAKPILPPSVEVAVPLKVGNARIELDKDGQVCKLEYPDGTVRTFEYDHECAVMRITDGRGRVTARNDDHSWTTTDARGRKLGTDDLAYLTVSRDGNMVWGYFRDGSIVIQRTDCSAIKTDKSGELLSYVSPKGRRFVVDDTGYAAYRVSDEDNIESLAEDVLRLQNWELAHYAPTANQISRVSGTIFSDNQLKALEPGIKIIVQVDQL
jgi:hypothetical protein